MASLEIYGGSPLYGTVRVGGCKNAVLPILFATLLTHGENLLENVPDITDVSTVLDILRAFGAQVSRPEKHTVRIDTSEVEYTDLDERLPRAIRASTYLIGSCLSRFGKTKLYPFGGCAFCERPIDYHLRAAHAFGARDDGEYLVRERSVPCEITFPAVSVGATVNALLLAAATDDVSVLRNVAIEPHVMSLVKYLSLAGAHITVKQENVPTITVRGARLCGVRMRMIPDMIEGGTYLLAGLITDGRVAVEHIDPTHLESLLVPLESAGVTVLRTPTRLEAFATRPPSALHLSTAPYPGLATDLAPLISAYLARLGEGSMLDTVFPRRTGYLDAYGALGASYHCEGARILFDQRSKRRHNAVSAPDLRAGAGTALLALATEGQTILHDPHGFILRGYEDFEIKLRSLGARIERG